MQRTTLIRHVLFAGSVAAGLAAMTGSAQACSDLPNICAMNAQHHQDMVDISAGYAYGDYYGEDDYYGDDYYDSGYYSGDIDYSSYSEDPGRSLSNEAASFAGAVAAQQAELAARLQVLPRPMTAMSMAVGTISRIIRAQGQVSIARHSTGAGMEWCGYRDRAVTMQALC